MREIGQSHRGLMWNNIFFFCISCGWQWNSQLAELRHAVWMFGELVGTHTRAVHRSTCVQWPWTPPTSSSAHLTNINIFWYLLMQHRSVKIQQDSHVSRVERCYPCERNAKVNGIRIICTSGQSFMREHNRLQTSFRPGNIPLKI